MQIRPLRPEEIDEFSRIEREAFVMQPAQTNEWLERSIKPQLENTRVLIGDDGEMKTALRIIFPRLWLGRASVPMPGITSVATPPENRRQRHVKQLLTSVMHELREAGYGISTLYPFYFPFYKRFGYEQVSASKSINVKFAQLQKFRSKTEGRWKRATSEQWEEFNAVYEKFCEGKFGQITRHKERWEWLIKGWGSTTNIAYLWYDAQGQARAYITYAFREVKEWEREMVISHMAWADQVAWHETLAFLANHDSQAENVRWATSPDDEFFALLDDPREAEEKIRPGYMLRILDAVRALQERPWSTEVKGAFTIGLRDDVLEWNNLNLHVEVAEGRAQVRSLPAAFQAGLSCDIRQLSQLYAGYLSPLRLARLGLLQSHNQHDLNEAQQLFSPPGQPASHMADGF